MDKSADSAITEATAKIPTGNSIGGSAGKEAVVGVGEEATQIEFTIKKKDEFTLKYNLSRSKAKVIVTKTIKIKAKKNDEAIFNAADRKSCKWKSSNSFFLSLAFLQTNGKYLGLLRILFFFRPPSQKCLLKILKEQKK